jgi:hypothetical protein
MKKMGVLIFVCLLGAGCDSTEKKTTPNSLPTKSQQVTDTLTKTSKNQQDTIQIVDINLKQLPKGIKYSGKIKQALRWIDSNGDNIILTTETGIYQNPKVNHENEGTDADIYAYHFVISENEAKSSWKVHDFIHDCPVDLEANFIRNTLQITDLNKNGIGEVWLMYKTACHGDVSPADMKIIMYEGNSRFKMSGQNKVEFGPGDYLGGDYTFDKAFKEGPKEFKDFAKNLWKKNIMQSWR